MMGYGHAAMGAAGFIALTSTSAIALGVSPQPVSVVAVGAVLTAGAALLPDMDHHAGTIAKSVPSVTILGVTLIPSPTEALASTVEDISGGHRHLTHSLIGILAATLLAFTLSLLHLPATAAVWVAEHAGWTLKASQIGGGHGVNIGVLIASVFLVSFAAKALHLTAVSGRSTGAFIMRSWLGPWIMGLAVGAYCAIWVRVDWMIFLPVIVALGTFIHCLGDTLTTQGVAWLQPWQGPAPESWRKATKHKPATDAPWTHKAKHVLACAATYCWPPNGYLRLPILGTAGSWREHVFDLLLGLYILLAMADTVLGTYTTHTMDHSLISHLFTILRHTHQ